MMSEDRVFDVRDYGAIGDGVTRDTGAIQSAIDECSAMGGGRVLLSGATYLSGTLFLRGGVRLVIDEGAVLLGSTDIADYSTLTFKNMYKQESHMDRCLIFAAGATSVGIEGAGTIDGQGGRSNFPNPNDAARNRPMLIRFLNCTRVDLSDIHLKDPAAWTAAFLYCSDIEVSRLQISSRANDNGDGLDFDGCARVHVQDSWFETSDDSICLQSSRVDSDCEDVLIERCSFRSKWAGIRVGLLSRGVIRRVRVEDCRFEDIEDAGIKIQMCEGGVIEDLLFRGCQMTNVERPVFVVMAQQRACVDAPDETPPVGRIDALAFEDLSVDCAAGSTDSIFFLSGLPGHRLGRCVFRNVTFRAAGGVRQRPLAAVPEYDDQLMHGWWPEFALLPSPNPASAFFARHIDHFSLEHVKVELARPDARPPVVRFDVHQFSLMDVAVDGVGLVTAT